MTLDMEPSSNGSVDTAPDLAITNALVVTMNSNRDIIEGGAIGITGDSITHLGRHDAAFVGKSTEVIDAGSAIVHPGFIDAHTHVSSHLGRSTIPDSWLGKHELKQYIPYAVALTEEDEYWAAILAFVEMALHGSTSFCDMGYKWPAVANAATQVGLRGVISPMVWDRAPDPRLSTGSLSASMRRLEEGLSQYPMGRGLLHAGVGLPGRGACSLELIKQAKELARDCKVPFYIHELYEPSPQSHGNLDAWEHLGILDSSTILIHMIHAKPEVIPRLAASSAHVVHCPSTAMRSGQQLSRNSIIPHMISAGINVALGTDAGNQSDFFDVGNQMYLTAMLHNDTFGPNAVNAESVLEMATINAARALGLDDVIGSIEVGKSADLVVRDHAIPESVPMLDVTTNFVYTAPAQRVRSLIVAGNVIIDEGRFRHFDLANLLSSVRGAAQRLHARMARMDFAPTQRWPLRSAR